MSPIICAKVREVLEEITIDGDGTDQEIIKDLLDKYLNRKFKIS